MFANHGKTIYCGVTNDLLRRTLEHKSGKGFAFTSRYSIKKLVWFETYSSIQDAIAREKQIKAGSRSRKVALIESMNPEWEDLSARLT